MHTGCDASTLSVVAKYCDSAWTDDDLTWMQYVQERAHEDTVGHSSPGRGAPVPLYNPYEYTNLADRPKDMRDGPPFFQTYDEMGAEYGVSHSPKILYDEDGILRDWYKARERDWTTDTTDQSPAISLDRRYASMDVDAASLEDVVNKDYHYTNDRKLQRSAAVALRPLRGNQEAMLKGLFEFTWDNKTPMDEVPRVVFQFLRPKGRQRPQSYLDYPVQMACNCKSFLYYGAQYYAVHGKYMYMPMFRPSLVPPVPETMISRVGPGKGLNFRVCKHILAAYKWFESQNLRILMHYRRYPQVGPPAKVMNAKEWKRLMGFPFTLEDLKKKLTGRRLALPRFFHTNFFRNKQQSFQLSQWFDEVWKNRDESGKIRVLETLVEHPEEIFYLLVKDAMEAPTKLSPNGIEKAYDLMSRVVQPDNDQEPEGKKYKRPGTRVVVPGQEPGEKGGPDVKLSPKAVQPTYKSVEPGVKSEPEKGMERFSPPKKAPKKKEKIFEPNPPGYVPPLLKKQRQIAQKLRGLFKSASVVVNLYLESLVDPE